MSHLASCPSCGSLLRAGLLGAISLLLGSSALLTLSLPTAGWLALPLSGLGLLLGVINLLGVRAVPRRGLLLPLAGALLCMGVLIGTLVVPGGRTGVDGGHVQSSTQPIVIPIQPRPSASGENHHRVPIGPAASLVDAAGWVDASRAGIQLDDARIHIRGVAVEEVPLRGAGTRPPGTDKYLVIRVRLMNVGAKRVLTYNSWVEDLLTAGQAVPTLQDDTGRLYAQQRFPAGHVVEGQLGNASLTTGRSVEERLVYPAPPEAVENLRLELPLGACELNGVARFRIPGSLIRR